MEQLHPHDRSRRSFLSAAPMAVAAAIALTNARALAESLPLRDPTPAPEAAYQLFTGETIASDTRALEANPGNNNLVGGPNFTVALTVEKAKRASEFEWHEGRDHVLQILDGATVVELGGTPKDGRNTKPGEWLAPASQGAEAVALKKGDILIIPRGTPHKRTTAGSVTLLLISPMGSAKA